ncbi:MAG: class A beta-lactamase [Alphaproteobacteria bacterium]|nr:MAG: class A beta-lactamase [Alphaproteobacteria bacterium]
MTSGAKRRAVRILGVAAVALAGCIPQAQSAQLRQPPRGPRPAQVQPQPRVAAPVPAATPAQRLLTARIRELGRAFEGRVGIAVRDVDTGWVADWQGDRFYPQQSVSKFWVALTALQRADAGDLDLDRRVTVTRNDLTLFHQPIAQQVGANGYTTTLNDLMFRALTQSDNTCNDIVLRHAGGPAAVREMLTRNRLDGIRFGPGERLLQSGIAGLNWQPAFSRGNAFFTARDAVPIDRRRAAFERYVEDPVDGATPNGITNGLARLQRGELLSAESTRRLLTIMSQTHTGPNRLRGGLAAGWTISHKTGTGQVLGAEQAGYNDIGILHAPDGHHYALAVMIGRTSTPLPARMELMQDVVRAAIAYHEATRDARGTR